jgi:hypothetical protein
VIEQAVSTSPLWVIRVGFVMSVVCPIFTRYRTFPDPVGTSQLGHMQTSFDYLVGAGEERRGHFEAELSLPKTSSALV